MEVLKWITVNIFNEYGQRMSHLLIAIQPVKLPATNKSVKKGVTIVEIQGPKKA